MCNLTRTTSRDDCGYTYTSFGKAIKVHTFKDLGTLQKSQAPLLYPICVIMADFNKAPVSDAEPSATSSGSEALKVSAGTAPPAKPQTTRAGQTWTRQLACKDPSCIVDHASGAQHDWTLQNEGKEKGEGFNGETEGGDDGDASPLNKSEEIYVGPADRLVTPLDVLETLPSVGEEVIYIVGTRGQKVTRIAGLEPWADTLEELVLRSNLVGSMEGIESLTKLTKLELYDNQVEDVSHLDALVKLTVLDLSFNAIRSMAPVAACPLLEELYLAQNKLKVIEGIHDMVHLRCLDLGANRIRTMAGVGLETLCNLQSLWLGKNKLECINDVEKLPKLRQLDCQNNRLTTLSWPGVDGAGIAACTALEELYLACNAITTLDGIPRNCPLSTVDLSTNGVESLEGAGELKKLSELWMTSSQIKSFEQLACLSQLPLECLYLEHSPIAEDFEYRKRVTTLIPSLEQLDATAVNRN